MIKAIQKQPDGTYLVSLEVTKEQLAAIRAVMEKPKRVCPVCGWDETACFGATQTASRENAVVPDGSRR